MKVVAHVGAHKTGSSLIQKFLRDNADRIRGNGISYIGRDEMNRYAGWGPSLERHPERLRERLDEVATAGATVAIFSHENALGRPFHRDRPGLYPDAARFAKALAGIIGDREHVTVLYLRPQAEFVESYYLQTLHEGGTETFETWLEHLDLASLSWRPVVGALRDAFGERVKVGDFRTIKHGQDTFLDVFFKVIDVRPGIPTTYKPVRNPSVGDKGMRMALAANPYAKTGDDRKAIRKFLQKHFNNRRYPRPALLTAAQRQELTDRYQAEYDELCGG